MKAKNIKINIIKQLIPLLIFLIFVIALFVYKMFYDKKILEKKTTLQTEINELRTKTNDYQERINEIKAFVDNWDNLPESKKNENNKNIDELTVEFQSLSKKYLIKNNILSISPQQKAEIFNFNIDSVNYYQRDVSINFNSIDDVNAILMLTDFLKSFPGYLILEKFDIKKIDNYTDDKLVELSLNKGNGVIVVNVKFKWYYYISNKNV